MELERLEPGARWNCAYSAQTRYCIPSSTDISPAVDRLWADGRAQCLPAGSPHRGKAIRFQ